MLFVSGSVAGADVGGTPTNDIRRCDGHARPCGKPYVLAEGRQFGGKREIVGLKSSLGACLSFERVGVMFSSPCDERAAPRPKGPLRIELESTVTEIEVPGNRRIRSTEIGGVLRPDVTRVQVVLRGSGERRVQDAITNQVDAALARKVGFRGPVGVFDLVVRGFPLSHGNGGIDLKAFDAEDNLLGVKHLGR